MKKYKFFAGMISSQETWLNKMSEQGYRLTGVTKAAYEFTDCQRGQYVYAVEYIGNMSFEEASSYKQFLEEFGYTVYYKNINLDYSFGKVEIRPWADKGGRISTDRTTHNKELLIVEKENDGKSFELHTTAGDKIEYYRALLRPSLFIALLLFIPGAILRIWSLLLIAALPAVPVIILLHKISQLKKECELEERIPEKKGQNLFYIGILVAVAVLCTVYTVSLGKIEPDSYTALGHVTNSTFSKWSSRYTSLNGHLSKRLNIKDGSLDVEVVTNSGELDILVTDFEDNILYEQTSVPSTTLSIPANGKIKIKLTARKHSGSYSFK